MSKVVETPALGARLMKRVSAMQYADRQRQGRRGDEFVGKRALEHTQRERERERERQRVRESEREREYIVPAT